MDNLCTSRIIRRKELAQRLGVSQTTIWRWDKEGKLPSKHKIGPNTAGWLESEIEAWWASKVAAETAS